MPSGTATLSVLDRLIDESPENTFEPPISPAESVRKLKACVARDLEWLLNARRIAIEPPESLRELNRSIYMFGLPDLTSFALSASKERTRLSRILQNAIKLFEPRLANPRVFLSETPDSDRLKLYFRVEALLLMDPAPERFFFDTELDRSSGRYSVKAAG